MNAPAKKVETERILLKEPVEDPPDKEHEMKAEEEGSEC